MLMQAGLFNDQSVCTMRKVIEILVHISEFSAILGYMAKS